MEQLYEHPKMNSKLDIHQLFPHRASSPNNPQAPDFVPFNIERDKLGRLISREQQHRAPSKRLSLRSEQQVTRRLGEVTDKGGCSDKAVERVFKVRSVHNLQSSRQGEKLKISVGAIKMMRSPSVGEYNTARISDQVKYPKPKMAVIKGFHEVTSRQETWKRQMKSNSKIAIKKEMDKGSALKIFNQKLQLNPDLPQLQKFHTMRRLQMKISPNFERDHLRFKTLVRQSLILANKIKRELQLDD